MVGQAEQRAVYSQQSMAAPAPKALALLGFVDDRQNTAAIQLDKGGVLELGPRMRPSTGSDQFKQIVTGQLIEKLIQVSLDRLHCLLQGEEHNDRESQLALAREILGSDAMSPDEIPVTQLATERFDKGDNLSGNAFNNGAHPDLK